jgi:hypothetical protein
LLRVCISFVLLSIFVSFFIFGFLSLFGASTKEPFYDYHYHLTPKLLKAVEGIVGFCDGLGWDICKAKKEETHH